MRTSPILKDFEMTKPVWLPEQLNLLKKLWLEGRTASEISRALGTKSRNAVIGKIHRMKTANNRKEGSSNNKIKGYPRWDKAQTDFLKGLLDEGKDCNEIARILGMSSNAISSKIHREKLKHSVPVKPKKKIEQPTLPEQIKERTAPLKRAAPSKIGDFVYEPIDGVEPVTFFELDKHHCRWHVGKETGAKQMFCGAEKIAGSSYCEVHQELSVSNFQAWKRRNRGAIWK